MEETEGIREKHIPGVPIQSRGVFDTHPPTGCTTIFQATPNTPEVVSTIGEIHIQLPEERDHPKINEQLEQPDLFDPQEEESSRHD